MKGGRGRRREGKGEGEGGERGKRAPLGYLSRGPEFLVTPLNFVVM